MPSARTLIETLDLTPHPEGGWFRETWRAPAIDGERPTSTAILFLLADGERSHWHSVDADEIWIWQDGDPLTLRIAPTGETAPTSLSLSSRAGHELQAVVPKGQWQAAEPQSGEHGYTLVTCVVAPGFDFNGFTLAPPEWSPGT
ncbi:hypothetical protein GGQ88_001483 [Novosphingobium hassiacum]|uniref:DUF985 domain-containing protein n=1 Tax=Novosphingobium hassiacum TaxID=173676 RepID=A0A7W5ZVM2_9SPHN|nr:cupin domain-containing protein [Novosphingobium hassiacum]MBB3860217.1 hypothetical protein [Novosphingobium hassiacum]